MQLEELNQQNYLLKNEPSVSSIEFMSNNTKFIPEILLNKSNSVRRLSGFDELYQALELKDEKICQLTSNLKLERQKIKNLTEDHSNIEMQFKLQDTEISQMNDEISQLTERLETVKFLNLQYAEKSQKNEDLDMQVKQLAAHNQELDTKVQFNQQNHKQVKSTLDYKVNQLEH